MWHSTGEMLELSFFASLRMIDPADRGYVWPECEWRLHSRRGTRSQRNGWEILGNQATRCQPGWVAPFLRSPSPFSLSCFWLWSP